MKKGFYKTIIVIVIILLVYSYFHVAGHEIDGASDISSECVVTITENYSNRENQRVYTLNEKQINELKKLILDSYFIRQFSSVVFFESGTNTYSIRIDYNDGRDPLMIDSIGNEYISILNQFNGKHLKIKNSNWEKTLEELINSSGE